MTEGHRAANRWLVRILLTGIGLMFSWKEYKLNNQRYRDEQSRANARRIHKRQGKVETTVEQMDPLGFFNSDMKARVA